MHETHFVTPASLLSNYNATDSVPGICDRFAFFRQINVLSSMQPKLCAMLVLDLDNLKILNLTFGQQSGFELICNIAGNLIDCINENDHIGKLGDCEFAIILTDVTELEAIAVANKIISLLSSSWDFDKRHYIGSVSIGVMSFFSDDSSDVLKKATIAGEFAKSLGGGVHPYRDGMLENEIAKADIISDLRKAILRNEFVLAFQPQIFDRNHFIGVEALVRWNRPGRGIVGPKDFIYAAEQSGLIIPIGYWVLKQACLQLNKWSKSYSKQHLSIAVNVSPRQFHLDSFVNDVISIILDTKIDPTKLKLELTENLLVENVAIAVSKLNALKKLGIQFSLDDFGTGHSSLSHLKHLPIDQLKIDRGFVSDIMSNPHDQKIVKAILQLGKDFGLTTIAEGVETEEQKDFLISVGCSEFQGYFFGKPMNIQLLDEWMSIRRV